MMTSEIRLHVADKLRDVWWAGAVVAGTLFVLGAVVTLSLAARVESRDERLDVIEARVEMLPDRIERLHNEVRQVDDDLEAQRRRFAEHAAYKGPIQTADERIDELEAYVATLEERLAAHAEHAAQNE